MHIHRVISDKFTQIEQVLSPVMDVAPQKPIEREINLKNPDWKRAGEKVPTQTTVGRPDRLPMQLTMQLMNLFGPKSKAIYI